MYIKMDDLPEELRSSLPDIIGHIDKFYSDVDVVGSEVGITLSSRTMSDEALRRIALAAASNLVLTRQANAGRSQILEMLLQ